MHQRKNKKGKKREVYLVEIPGSTDRVSAFECGFSALRKSLVSALLLARFRIAHGFLVFGQRIGAFDFHVVRFEFDRAFHCRTFAAAAGAGAAGAGGAGAGAGPLLSSFCFVSFCLGSMQTCIRINLCERMNINSSDGCN